MKPFSIGNIEELSEALQLYNVPIAAWGIANAKSLNHLFAEISKGEALLYERDLQLVRHISVAILNVFRKTNSGIYNLREHKQVFRDGRVRVRNFEYSIYEKLLPNEDPISAAYRAIDEELYELTEELSLETPPPIIFERTNYNERFSTSYPGLLSTAQQHYMSVIFKSDDIRNIELKEEQEDKITLFKWDKILE